MAKSQKGCHCQHVFMSYVTAVSQSPEHRGGKIRQSLTFFEALTVLAFAYFRKSFNQAAQASVSLAGFCCQSEGLL